MPLLTGAWWRWLCVNPSSILSFTWERVVSAAVERGIKGTSDLWVVTPEIFCAAAKVKICHSPRETPSLGPESDSCCEEG